MNRMIITYLLVIEKKARQKLCFLLLCFLFAGSLSATPPNSYLDSLIKVKDATKDTCDKAWEYIEIARTAFGSDMQLSLDFANEGILLTENSKCYGNLANLYLTKSIILNNMGKLDASISSIDKAISIYQNKVKKTLNLGKAFHSKGNVFLKKDELPEAIDNYLKALTSIANNKSDSEVDSFKALVLSDLGGAHSKLNQHDSALYYLNLSVELEPLDNDPDRFITYHYNMSTIYKVKDSFDLALKHVNKADSMNQFVKNPNHQIDINLNKAYILSFTGKHDKAIELMESTEELLKIIPNLNSSYHYFFSTYSKVHYKAKHYKEAINISLRHLDSIDLEMSKGSKANALHNLFLAYEALGNFEKALYFYKEYKRVLGSISGENTQNEISRLKEEFESVKKANEINLLKEKDKISQLEIKRKDDALRIKTYFIFLLSILFLSLIVIGLFIYRHAKIRQQKRSVELEHQALRTQMNPHFIFNALNSIQRIYVEGNIKKANNFMADFSQLMRKILENSRSSKITLSEEIETLRLYMDLEKLRSKDCFTYQIDIDESVSLSMKIAPLLLQPFVENSIWHGVLPLENKEGQISIKITDLDEDVIQVEIKDNGVGFDSKNQFENNNSKGISITKQRIEGDVIIDSTRNVGTTVSFKIKKQDD